MFEEELSGNTSRKRQDQARQRRRQAKQRTIQEQKKQTSVAAHSSKINSHAGTEATTSSATPFGTATSAIGTSSVDEHDVVGVLSSASTTTAPSSAIANALEQRKLRACQKRQLHSSTIIQSFYRSYRSNNRLMVTQKDTLDKRLNDMVALGTILKTQQQQQKQTNTNTSIDISSSTFEYAPPPSLAIGMINQLLFITHTIPRFHNVPHTSNKEERDAAVVIERVYHSKIRTNLSHSDANLISRLVKHVLLPGVLSADVHMDPMVVWLESKEGLVRLKKLLRLCCFTLVAKKQSPQRRHRAGAGGGASSSWSPFLIEDETKDIHAIIHFLRRILLHGTDSTDTMRQMLTSKCKSMLLSSNVNYRHSLVISGNESNTGGNRIKILGQMAVTTEPLDLIHLLRSFLFCPSGTIVDGSILPLNAEDLREKCIHPRDRARGDSLFNLVLDVTILHGSRAAMDDTNQNDRRLYEIYQCRFFADILTCPLLTWKIESRTVMNFVRYPDPVDPDIDTNTMPSAGRIVDRQPSLLRCVFAFIGHFEREISQGLIGSSSVLPTDDVPLSMCPAPTVLCLLANMVLLGKLCPTLNGSDGANVDFDAGAIYFNAIAAIVDVVPLGTFSSRQSSVEWVSHGSHLTPIVLSQVIRDQCKQLLVDSYVRGLFNCAIDDQVLNSDLIINRKDRKDVANEKELQDAGSSSATALAAQDAMVDRSKKFWQSRWAKKLSKKMTSIFSADKKNEVSTSAAKGEGNLVNTSSISRQLAHGAVISDQSAKTAVLPSKNEKKKQEKGRACVAKKSYNVSFLFALCRTYAIILSRWGGGGKDDMVKVATTAVKKPSGSESATSEADLCIQTLLNVLCFSTPVLKTLWAIIQSDARVVADLHTALNVNKRSDPIRSLSLHENIGAVILLIFTMVLAHTLIITDDIELHTMDTPLPPHQIRRLILVLKQLLYRACCLDDVKIRGNNGANHLGLSLISASSKTMRDLYKRSSRRPLCVPKLWLVNDLMEADIKRCDNYEDYVRLLELPVLRICPFLVSFKCRLKIFERIVTNNRISVQGRNDGLHARPGVSVNIMRGRVLEDGLIHLNKLGRNLRQRIIVNYQNQAGAQESGIDAGGLFKEFWADLSTQSFNPNYALFRVTEGTTNCLYPNPSSRSAHGAVSVVMFEFLGRILGKALYEGITIKPQFAHFFLSFLRGEYNFLNIVEDLTTLDSTLYNNLMFLKTYDGDARDLCLTFTVSTDHFGVNKEIPLIPNGADMEVTNANKHHYIGLVAKHYVYDRVTEQSQAFTRGLWDVIDRDWLRIFSEPELQVLISGPSDGKIDITDMKANTRYSGGYSSFDRNITRFWSVVSSFDNKQQAELLRFVTSCERPPPLGFASMNPPFTIQRVGIMSDGEKLPTASTCFNILKLPTYSSEKVLRERLLYSIQSGTGFELS